MRFRSPFPDLTIPDVSLPAFVLERAAERGERPALVDGVTGRTITYGELPGLVRRAAAGLAARGFGRGDVFAIWSPNVIEYAVAIHAVLLLGGTVTTANPLYTVDELSAQLADARARILLTIAPLLPVAREAATRAGVREVLVFGEPPEDSGATPFAALFAHGDEPPSVAVDPATDLAFLPYSSGTTGLPKGVMLTHRNIVANILQTTPEAVRVVRGDDRVLAVLPFFHIYGLVPVLNASLVLGATLVVLPRFELEGFLRAMSTHRVSVAFVVPPIVLALAKHPAVAGVDLSALRLVFSGAAPLDAGLAHACATRLGCTVRQGYGLTESSPVTHLSSPDDPPEKIGAVGRLVANCELRIVDLATRLDAGPNAEGEVLIRGPQVMRGYLDRPDATAHTLDADGWLHTGDVGYVDADGYLSVVDRVKELIKYKGMQVAPAELEGLLLAHPDVADVAVIPLPDEEAGEVPAAYVVPRAGVAAEGALGDTLRAWVAARVAPHKRIRQVTFVEQIPKSPSGKILRRVLVARARAESGGVASGSLPAGTAYPAPGSPARA